jgi:hypothetical protein
MVGRAATASKLRRDQKAYICPAQQIHICRLGIDEALLHLKIEKIVEYYVLTWNWNRDQDGHDQGRLLFEHKHDLLIAKSIIILK